MPLAILAATLLSACNDPSSTDSPYIVTPVTTATLSGTPGWALADTLVVEVRDVEGNLVPGAKVTWSLPNGGRMAVQLADADNRLTGTTDDQGRNYAVWTLGLDEGTQVAKVAAGFGESATFSASGTALHAIDVTVGESYACAITDDLRPVCWGTNHFGELGVGDTTDRAMPTPVQGLAAALQVEASKSSHTCARDLAGDVWCWGWGLYGQTGPVASIRQLEPARVPGAEAASTIALGYAFSCAILSAGGARCWGTGEKGRLGAGFIGTGGSSYPTPLVVVGGGQFESLSIDYDRACAIDSSGEAWCWGNAGSGQLSPYPSGSYGTPIRPVPGSQFSETALNWYTNCGIAVGGVVLCWGWNVGLGYDSYSYGVSAPVLLLADGPFAQLTTNGPTFYGRTRDGRVLRWGLAASSGGVLKPSEIQLGVRAIGLATSYNFGYCIIAESGALYCDNSTNGTLGLRAFPAGSVP